MKLPLSVVAIALTLAFTAYAGAQQQPGPQSQISSWPRCGRGYCPPDRKCVSGSVCVQRDAVDCGNGVFCAVGQKCSSGGGCLPQDAVDCGRGFFCNPGMVCVGTAECITEAEAARRQADAQKKAELAQDKILCAKHNSINEAIAACTRLIQSSQLTERELAYVYFLRSMRWKAQGDVQRSQGDYRESLKNDPFFPKKLSSLLELDNHGVVTFSCGERYCDAGLVCVANNCVTSQQVDLAESEDAWHQRRAEYNDSEVTKASFGELNRQGPFWERFHLISSDFTTRLGIPLVAIPIALVVLTVLLLIYRAFRDSRSTSVVNLPKASE